MANVRISEDNLRENLHVSRAFIPFFSGSDIKLSTRSGGIPGFPAFIGLGSNDMSINYLNGVINLDDEFANYAIPLAESGIIDTLVATFYTFPISIFGSSVITVCTQLYYADNTTNIFKPIKETLLRLKPNYNGNFSDKNISYARKSGINAKLNSGTRILLLFFTEAEGGKGITEIRGYASAGISII
ncbi:MAG: hypothetical protein M0R05_02355 [Bacilli bacterium]|nr:hypothetical protein [Bacilli bacterium]MDD4076947.1 hypothetical protein [Bacilli bacterium]MDD4387657.1 hypothetical protein [Bacilli bacterium]